MARATDTDWQSRANHRPGAGRANFAEHHLPEIYNAIRIISEGFDVPEPIDIIAEVQQHLGEGRVRAVAMKPTEGMVRGMKADRHGRTHYRAGRPRHAGPHSERAGRAGG